MAERRQRPLTCPSDPLLRAPDGFTRTLARITRSAPRFQSEGQWKRGRAGPGRSCEGHVDCTLFLPKGGKLMEVRTKLLGHPIHQMLVNFPLGLLPTAVIFDIIYLSTHNPRWADVAFWMIAAGIIGALIA